MLSSLTLLGAYLIAAGESSPPPNLKFSCPWIVERARAASQPTHSNIEEKLLESSKRSLELQREEARDVYDVSLARIEWQEKKRLLEAFLTQLQREIEYEVGRDVFKSEAARVVGAQSGEGNQHSVVMSMRFIAEEQNVLSLAALKEVHSHLPTATINRVVDFEKAASLDLEFQKADVELKNAERKLSATKRLLRQNQDEAMQIRSSRYEGGYQTYLELERIYGRLAVYRTARELGILSDPIDGNEILFRGDHVEGHTIAPLTPAEEGQLRAALEAGKNLRVVLNREEIKALLLADRSEQRDFALSADNQIDLSAVAAIHASDLKGLKRIIAEHPDVIHYQDHLGFGLPHYAAASGNLEVIEFLKSKMPNFDSLKSRGDRTAFDIAVSAGQSASVQALLGQQLKVESRHVKAFLESRGLRLPSVMKLASVRSGVHFSAISDLDLQIIQKLVAKGRESKEMSQGSVNRLFLSLMDEYHSSLQDADKLEIRKVIRALGAAGADVNVVNSSGQTPLMIAARKMDLELVKDLLSLGALRSLKDPNGRRAIDLFDAQVANINRMRIAMPERESMIQAFRDLLKPNLLRNN